ncbi:hypothetical protein MSAN_01881600 [Mycena sanguinolenta]|uniref:F-box domain-containing protein n=1 Tax=Mycena sanguinolenta TaxID=230812 RepID=A0A8H6XUH7_9AGAR|nr:hypothetical protein MSAN_01881600 [Mycena sanguinolenta]
MSLSDSPFTDRLNTNYVPSPSEILEIRSLLVDPLEEIARIDAQIEKMELTLAQLREKRALLQRPIDAHRALISPMRLIPRDILLEIFFACLPSEHNALIDLSEAPLLFGRICRHWRSVAYSTPMLWSSIHIPPLDYLNTPPNILSGLERVVEAWLERSAACPLSISLYDLTNRLEFNPNLGKHPLALQIIAVSRRLRYLALAGDAELLCPILQLGSEKLPSLKTFQMITLSNQTPSTNILDIPTLKDVALTVLENSAFTLSLAGQCMAKTGGLDFEAALDVLRRCPNLEQCEIRVTTYSVHSGSNPSPIMLPQLHTLALIGWDFDVHKWVDLVAPNLRSLRIGAVSTPSTPPSNEGYLSADIDFTRFIATSLREFLQSLPMISHLQLVASLVRPGSVSLNDEFMALFCSPHNLCPRLTHINIPFFSDFSDTATLAFIRARMDMPTPLRRFQARFDRPMDLDIMPELQSFISDGLQVNLEYPRLESAFSARLGLDDFGSFY